MISSKEIEEILAQYRKHGWNLRRVLLCEPLEKNRADELFGTVEIVLSTLNAAWFARSSVENREAWELRHFSTAPFALVEVFNADEDEDAREEVRRAMETCLLEKASNFGRQKPETEI